MTNSSTHASARLISAAPSGAAKPAFLGGTPICADLPSTRWPPLDDATERRLVEVYRSGGWSFNGPVEQEFCQQFAAAHGAQHAVFMVNGTVTLEAILHTLGVGPGDEVIVPALTWPASAMAALYVGATPVFVDIDPGTLGLDHQLVEQAITPRTKAIMPVHLYGGMPDMDALLALGQRRGIAIVEDCAHAHGGAWNGRGLGSLGVAGSFSFQQSKTMAAGEGGIVLTNDEALAERLYRYKHIGYAAGSKQGQAQVGPPAGLICHNYRATDFQAAILCEQLKRLPQRAAQRDVNAQWLTAQLQQIPGLRAQQRGRCASPQSYYCYMFTYDPTAWAGATAAQLRLGLKQEGVPATLTYGSVYRHVLWNVPATAFRIHGDYRDARGSACRVSEEIGTQRTLGFPHQVLDFQRGDLQKIVDAVARLQHHAADLARLEA